MHSSGMNTTIAPLRNGIGTALFLARGTGAPSGPRLLLGDANLGNSVGTDGDGDTVPDACSLAKDIGGP
mgnify:CR=1 FL=1